MFFIHQKQNKTGESQIHEKDISMILIENDYCTVPTEKIDADTQKTKQNGMNPKPEILGRQKK